MRNPFESGQIKNYLLFYGGVVAIVVLFFIASTLFHETKEMPKKSFVKEQDASTAVKEPQRTPEEDIKEEPRQSRFKLLEKTY